MALHVTNYNTKVTIFSNIKNLRYITEKTPLFFINKRSANIFALGFVNIYTILQFRD
jgi:hypothetical protein